MHGYKEQKEAPSHMAANFAGESGLLLADNRPNQKNGTLRSIPNQSVQRLNSSVVQRAAVIQLEAIEKEITLFARGDGDAEVKKSIGYDNDPSKRLSQGADGEVFTGTLEGEAIIVKVAKESGVAAQTNEIETFKKLSAHENIIKGIGYSADKRVLALHKAEGSLISHLPESTADRIKLVANTHTGLNAMHDQHITHGDLNLKNILIENKKAKLTDFGASKAHGEGASATKTEAINTDRRAFLKAALNIINGEKDVHPSDGRIATFKAKLVEKGIPPEKAASLGELIKKTRAFEAEEKFPTKEELATFIADISA